MSIEVINWALTRAPIPRDRRDASSLAVVLVGLANHADPDGRNAFPSLARLAWYTRLSERSVRYALRALEELGLIQPSDPEIVAAYVKRADRRPNGYNLAVHHVGSAVDEGQTLLTRGANNDTARGKACPRTVLNLQRNRPAPEARSPLPPPCRHCDARLDDPVSARVIWSDADRTRSTLCPRCHPSANHAGGAR